MESNERDPRVHYKLLADLAGEAKMEALEVLEMGHEKLKELEKSFPMLVRFARALKPVFEQKKAVPQWVYDLYKTHQEIKEYIETFVNMSKVIHKLPAKGWYLSIEFIDAFAYEDPAAFMENDLIAFEAEALETYNRLADRIQSKLLEAHPRRVLLINAIFRLHAAGDHVAAIPLALSQADGICKDNFTIDHKSKKIPVGFFSGLPPVGKLSSQRLAKSFDLPGTSIFNVLCNQLAAVDKNSSVVLESNSVRMSDLNRNAIMHGESVDYGTEINSVKAILLLDFIEDLRLVNETINRGKQPSGLP